MSTETQNPCTFKPVCKTCKLAQLDDRPSLCKSMRCEDYTPCAKCGKNVPVYKDKKCAACSKDPKAEQTDESQELHSSSLPPISSGKFSNGTQIPERKFSVTVPGQPPPEYNDEERSYYVSQWSEYQGYFRDPSAYPICHAIILSEIEMNHVNTMLIQSRMSDDDSMLKALEQRQSRVIDNLKKMREQLPKKEALEFSEDEKAIAAIYERYCGERLRRHAGGVSRVLSPEAIALAPALHFRVDVAEILSRLGYDTISIQRAIELVYKSDELPKDPILLLEAMGIMIREKVVEIEPTNNRSAFPQENESDLDDGINSAITATN